MVSDPFSFRPCDRIFGSGLDQIFCYPDPRCETPIVDLFRKKLRSGQSWKIKDEIFISDVLVRNESIPLTFSSPVWKTRTSFYPER